ncbi:MAG TPA: PhzF family phenazine biosynthesis protein [Baekduia sp.]|nr:PhzF family phenazine biosynthesis protein [Baekduia sp.]
MTWLDVFTSRPLTGNGLAVVHGADDLDAEQMLAFARETNLSETTFVQTASVAGADYRNRIFDGLTELRFAGHPSLGTAAAVAHRAGVDQATYVQETLAGQHSIDVEFSGPVARTSMLQPEAALGETLDPGPALAALGLGVAAAHPDLPVMTGSTGIAHLLVPLRDDSSLGAIRPDAAAHRTLTDATGAFVVYAFVADGDRVRARGFFRSHRGMTEDPATGSAAGPLAAYLSRFAGTDAVVIEQGDEMGRPSRIEAEVVHGGIRVGGDTVVVLDGELHL